MSKKKVNEIIRILEKEYPNAKIALNFGTNFQLLVAVILSAQCTDERVNNVTPALFKKYPTAKDFASADLEDLEKMVYSTGFYRNKAKNIKAAAQKIINNFNGDLPGNMKELLTLPGVARKTANVVMSEAFGRSAGIVVDTHVARLSGRLGLVPSKLAENKRAVQIEKKLVKFIPEEKWGVFPHLLILHGRNVCKARKPNCSNCKLNKLCPSAFKV